MVNRREVDSVSVYGNMFILSLFRRQNECQTLCTDSGGYVFEGFTPKGNVTCIVLDCDMYCFRLIH